MNTFKMEWTTLTVIITILIAAECNCEIVEAERRWFTIEGRVQAPPTWINQSHLPEWKLATQILINDGQYRAFLKDDASFKVVLPSGSYVIHVYNPSVHYEPIRVETNTNKGKIRARKVDNIQPNVVVEMDYPLDFKPGRTFRYFQLREQWKITDYLGMMPILLLPVICLFVINKILQYDPEARKVFIAILDLEDLQQLTEKVPDMSQVLTNLFGGKTKKVAINNQIQDSSNDGNEKVNN